MMPAWWPALFGQLWAYSLPFACYLACRPRPVSKRARLALALGFVGLTQCALWLGVDPLHGLVLPALGLGYFAVLALAVCAVARTFRGHPPSKAVLLGLLAFAFIVVPARLLPQPGSVFLQLLGWELTLSAYSYCQEAGRSEHRPGFGESVFFLLLNPVLVFPERGRRLGPPALAPWGLWRCSLGLCALALHNFLYEATYHVPALGAVPLFALTSAAGYVRFTLYHTTRLLAGYAGHAGLASFQIGWMRLIGHRVPERYVHPLLATSPADFWRRWNTYVGSWARRYIFQPLSQGLRRRFRRVPRAAPLAVAVMATFLAIGAGHDFSLLVRHGHLAAPGGTLVFALHGLALLSWVCAARLLPKARQRLRLPRPGVSVASWVVFMNFLLLSLWLAIPGMSGQGLSGPLYELGALLGTSH